MEETLYEWRKRMGLCVGCGKERPFHGYVKCAACIEKAGEASRKCRAKEENRIKYNQKARERKKELIEERKEKGLCPSCGKPPKGDYIYCERCRRKKNEARRAKSYRRPGEHFRERIERGVCMYCGGVIVPGYKLCKECLEKRRNTNKKSNKQSSKRWRKEITAEWNGAKKKNLENG